MRIGDHQLHAAQAVPHQALEKTGPEGFRLGRADMQADDLAPAFGVNRHGDYHRDGDDPALPSRLVPIVADGHPDHFANFQSYFMMLISTSGGVGTLHRVRIPVYWPRASASCAGTAKIATVSPYCGRPISFMSSGLPLLPLPPAATATYCTPLIR